MREQRMHYFDTSFLVPLTLPETTSASITQFFAELLDGDLAVSQ